MSISHTCQYCGKSLPVGTKCECRFKQSKFQFVYKPFETNSAKPSAKSSTRSDNFYHSDDWRRLRLVIMSIYNNIDIYSWYKYGRLEPGFIVHHIIPLKDDYSKRADISNLIYLTDDNHRLIHSLMDESDEKKKEVQKELFDMIERWKFDSVM